MDHNAWSPAGPGQHGYMQVGLGRDAKLFNDDGEERHVFVGTGRFFLYCGWYHVQRVTALTAEEWATLPDKVCVLAPIHAAYDLHRMIVPGSDNVFRNDSVQE